MDDKSYVHLARPSPKKESYSRNETSYRKHSPWALSRPIRSPYMELSPTGRSTIPSGERASLMDWISTSDDRFMSSPRRELSRYADLRSNNQNSVDTERIRLGLDVRTTVCAPPTNLAFRGHRLTSVIQIMLRNIPNKIDQVGAISGGITASFL